MSKTIVIVIGIALLLVLLLFSMTYTVNYHEVAIRTRFGKTDSESVIKDPGLKFRLPLIADKVTTLDTRLQMRETALDIYQTADRQQLHLKGFMLWQVDNDAAGKGPLLFFNSFPGGMEEANQLLLEQFKTEIRAGVSRFRFDDLIGASSRLKDVEDAILAGMMKEAQAKGIQPKSVGISQLVLPSKTAQAVLQRMEAERTSLSQLERARGDNRATGIQSQASAQAGKIKAFAEQRAAEIRSQGDKDAAKINAALAKDGGEDLAVFELWLETLRTTLSQQTTMVLPWTYAPFHLLNFDAPGGRSPIPMPTQDQQQGRSEPARDGDIRLPAPATPAAPATSGGS